MLANFPSKCSTQWFTGNAMHFLKTAARSLYCMVLLRLFFKLKAALSMVVFKYMCRIRCYEIFFTHWLTVASPTQQNFVHRPARGSNIVHITCSTVCGCQGTAHPGSCSPIICYMMASHTPHLQCSQPPWKFNNTFKGIRQVFGKSSQICQVE